MTLYTESQVARLKEAAEHCAAQLAGSNTEHYANEQLELIGKNLGSAWSHVSSIEHRLEASHRNNLTLWEENQALKKQLREKR